LETLVTLREAALLSGRRSPSSIYRLKDDRILSSGNYLRGRPGKWRIELQPEGQRPFVEWLNTVLGAQGPLLESEQRHREPGPWDHIPEALRSCDGSEPFWVRFGTIAGPEDPALSDDELWEHVHKIVIGMMGTQICESPLQLADLFSFIADALDDVEAGARWNQANWDRATVETTLVDMPCPLCARTLRRMLESGTVPADLAPAVEEALAAMPEE